MSVSKGTKYLSPVLMQAYLKSGAADILFNEYRKQLDQQRSIVGISAKDLFPNAAIGDSRAAYNQAYKEFLAAVEKYFSKFPNRVYADIQDFYDKIDSNSSEPQKFIGVRLIRSPIALIGVNFDSIRNFISNISETIPNNIYFGKSDRVVHYSEFGRSTIEEADNTAEAAKIRARYAAKGSKVGENGRSIFDSEGYVLASDGKRLLAPRSVVDIGHIAYDAKSTPLVAKLTAIISSDVFSKSVKDAAAKSLKQVKRVHSVVGFNFKNTSATTLQARGELTLTLQHIKINSALARVETQAYNDTLKAIMKEMFSNDSLLKTPGSNTLIEDAVELVANRISGKKVRVKPHSSVNVSISDKKTIEGKGLSLGSLKGLAKAPNKLKPGSGESTSLAALQVLLDKHLQDVISANMGDQGYVGGQRKILNYRTGRFAASAKVARLSQSREGMITAFYTYMKNPYQTFEPGFKQGSPKTRDPKLLIAGSIREIASTLVGNRMRSVAL